MIIHIEKRHAILISLMFVLASGIGIMGVIAFGGEYDPEVMGHSLDEIKWEQLDTSFKGVVWMWSGEIYELPPGWRLCDGEEGTPNLMDKFIVGAGNSYNIGEEGGEDFHTLTTNEMPSHGHGLSYLGRVSNARYDLATHTPYFQLSDRQPEFGTYGISATAAGGGGSHENRPPYYALAYICKL